MQIFCVYCRNQFILKEGPLDREVSCRWCEKAIRIVGVRAEPEIWAEKWVEVLTAGTKGDRRKATRGLIGLGPAARKYLPKLIEILRTTGTSEKPGIVAAVGA